MICPKCGTANERGSVFCQNCGASLGTGIQGMTGPAIASFDAGLDSGFVTNVEKKIYFKIARGFAWFILFVAALSLIGSVFYLARTLPSFLVENTNVTKDEVQTALSEEERGRHYVPSHGNDEKIDIDLIKKMDSEITDIIYLFPDDVRRNERDIDEIRRILKNHLSYWQNMKDRISVVKSLKNEMKGFSGNPQRTLQALVKFVELKKAKEEFVKEKRSKAMIEVGIAGGSILTMIIIITLGSLVLVLMAIERNTRRNSL